jgi:hypothetical protein
LLYLNLLWEIDESQGFDWRGGRLWWGGDRFGLRVGRGGQEDRQVVAFGDLDDQGFGGPLRVEVGGELEAEEPGLTADDAVLAGVETGGSLEDLDAYLLLGSVLRGIAKGAGGDVEEEIAEPNGANEVGALNDALNQFPAWIPCEINRLIELFYSSFHSENHVFHGQITVNDVFNRC